MNKYVVGFLFDKTLSRVALVKKNRPEWQAGRWNGVGGKVEQGEGWWAAISREFKEEAGVYIGPEGWRRIAILNFPEAELHAFMAISTEALEQVRTITDEPIDVFYVLEIMLMKDVIPNVRWLIQMAQSFHIGERADEFIVIEAYNGK